LGKGRPEANSLGRLVDAQGVEIPVEATQDMEIALRDMTGRVILLCQTAGAAIPLELQNKSMVVHGNIRILSGQCVPAGSFHVRAIQADVEPGNSA
jgi:hypothetical protein